MSINLSINVKNLTSIQWLELEKILNLRWDIKNWNIFNKYLKITFHLIFKKYI